MRQLLHVALFDLRQQVVDKSSIFFMFIMPMGFIVFFGFTMRNSPQDSVNIALPIVQGDDEFLAQAFVDQLQGESFNTEIYTPAEAASDSVELEVRWLDIPRGFSDSLVVAAKATLKFTKRPTSNVSYDAAADLNLHKAQVRFLGNLMRWELDPKLGRQGAAALSPVEKGKFLSLVNDPPTVTLETSTAGRGRPVPTGMGQSIPGMVAMFVVMTVLIAGSEAITREKAEGTLRRLATTVLSPRDIFTGKLLGLAFLGLVQAGIIIVGTEIIARTGIIPSDFSWLQSLFAVVVLLVPYTLCVAAIGLFVSGLFRTTQQAESLAWLIGMVFAGLGGCWWPLEIVPPWLRTVGHLFPTAWAMDGLHGAITFGHGLQGVITPVIVLTIYAAIFMMLGMRTMRVAD